MVCSQLNVPVYGALLNGLLNRCDDEGMGDISWPEGDELSRKGADEFGQRP